MLTGKSKISGQENINYSKNVYIIGLGWLGIPLARQLRSFGFVTNGTVRTKSKQNQLKSIQIDADLMQLNSDYPKYKEVFKRLDYGTNNVQYKAVVLNIPPGRTDFNANAFVKCMTKLIDDLFDLNVDRLVFISTTSVFGNLSGDITLETKVQPVTQSAIAHVEIEQYLLTKFADKTVILRPAGLIGENLNGSYRHPVYSLSKKEGITKGENAVNLIHQQDIINCIQRALELDLSNIALNLSSLEHPTRREYYTWCANKLGLQSPKFFGGEESADKGKIIRVEESLEKLGNLNLEYPSPFDMLGS